MRRESPLERRRNRRKRGPKHAHGSRLCLQFDNSAMPGRSGQIEAKVWLFLPSLWLLISAVGSILIIFRHPS